MNLSYCSCIPIGDDMYCNEHYRLNWTTQLPFPLHLMLAGSFHLLNIPGLGEATCQFMTRLHRQLRHLSLPGILILIANSLRGVYTLTHDIDPTIMGVTNRQYLVCNINGLLFKMKLCASETHFQFAVRNANKRKALINIPERIFN